MNQEEIIDPKNLLKAIKNIENESKGKLKVFLGMSAGVGKTYAMLELAQKKIKEGFDVVVGVVCTHGRRETQELLKGIKVIDEKIISYKDKTFSELNLDEIIKQKPDIVLIDELAHSNIPGSKHLKRWQDILEVLEKGIDVYTTVNIQHIESYKDIVEQISGISIRETVPDKILENADNIEVVDLTPQDLLQRFKEGKVYVGDTPLTALNNFFREEKLTALREIVLRFSANIVDEELNRMVYPLQTGKNWNQREKLLVIINFKQESEEIIRITKRMAFALHAPWLALYIESDKELSKEENIQLSKNLLLARDLGAEVITVPSSDPFECVSRVVKQKRITQIYAYKQAYSLKNLFHSSLIDQLSQRLQDIDIHLVRKSSKQLQINKESSPVSKNKFLSYLKVLFTVLIISSICWVLLPSIGYESVTVIFLLSIIGLGFFFSKGPIIVAAISCAIIWSNFFKYRGIINTSFLIYDAILLILFLIVSTFIAILTSKACEKEKILKKREASLSILNDIIKEIAEARTFEEVSKGVKEKVSQALDGSANIIINPKDPYTYFENDKERAVASYSFENDRVVGWSTQTLPSVKNLYIPLKSYRGVLGVLAFSPNNDQTLLPKQLNFLHTVASLIANYFERHFREEKEREIKAQKEIDKTHENILNAIASKLTPPIEQIREAYIELGKFSNNSTTKNSLMLIRKALLTLQGISEKAHSMAELSLGLIHFQKEASDVKLIIQNAFNKLQDDLKSFNVILSIQDNLPLINCDKSLIEICLINFLSNSIENSDASTRIEIECKIVLDSFVLAVLDEGPGILEGKQKEIFEKFYALPGSRSSGLGLGLSIAQSIATMHNAKIEVINRPIKGLKVSFIMPL